MLKILKILSAKWILLEIPNLHYSSSEITAFTLNVCDIYYGNNETNSLGLSLSSHLNLDFFPPSIDIEYKSFPGTIQNTQYGGEFCFKPALCLNVIIKSFSALTTNGESWKRWPPSSAILCGLWTSQCLKKMMWRKRVTKDLICMAWPLASIYGQSKRQ